MKLTLEKLQETIDSLPYAPKLYIGPRTPTELLLKLGMDEKFWQFVPIKACLPVNFVMVDDERENRITFWDVERMQGFSIARTPELPDYWSIIKPVVIA